MKPAPWMRLMSQFSEPSKASRESESTVMASPSSWIRKMVLDASTQPTFVDPQAAVCWSTNLAPSIKNDFNFSIRRGGRRRAVRSRSAAGGDHRNALGGLDDHEAGAVEGQLEGLPGSAADAGFMAGGLFNLELSGHGFIAVCCDGEPMVLDASTQITGTPSEGWTTTKPGPWKASWKASPDPPRNMPEKLKSFLIDGGEAAVVMRCCADQRAAEPSL
jgi:hypothetical protein